MTPARRAEKRMLEPKEDDFHQPMFSLGLAPDPVPQAEELPPQTAWSIWDVWVRVSDWKTARRLPDPKERH